MPTSAFVCIYCYLLLVFRLLLSVRLLNDSFVLAVASHTGEQPLITPTTRGNPPCITRRYFNFFEVLFGRIYIGNLHVDSK